MEHRKDPVALICLCASLLVFSARQAGHEATGPQGFSLVGDLCVVEVTGLRAARCQEEGAWRLNPSAPERVRRTLGWAPCWWTAGPDDFARLAGVGAATAERLVVYRDGGGLPESMDLQIVQGVGPSLSARIQSGVETDCGPCWEDAGLGVRQQQTPWCGVLRGQLLRPRRGSDPAALVVRRQRRARPPFPGLRGCSPGA